jgi:hypothetical protein
VRQCPERLIFLANFRPCAQHYGHPEWPKVQ